MNENIATSYDRVPYLEVPWKETHPERLCTIAKLFGREYPNIENCRVLELGCASGANLLPMAAAFPEASFLGVDLSSQQIERGNALIQSSKLRNITLETKDITEFPLETEEFDFIICHGVFSWVPEEVQQKILEICSGLLSPKGLAFISYNTYPGWHFNGLAREIMLYQAKFFDEPEAKVDQAKKVINFMASALKNDKSPYAISLQRSQAQLQGKPDSYIFHEYLEEFNAPMYFHQFIEKIESHELNYLGDARLSTMFPLDLSPEVQSQIQNAARDSVSMEQYLDFIHCRVFRRSILYKGKKSLNQRIDPMTLQSMFISSDLTPTAPLRSLLETTPESFSNRNQKPAVINTPIAKAALLHLRSIWPASVAFPELLEIARNALVAKGGNSIAGKDELEVPLASELLNLFIRRRLDLSVYKDSFTTDVSEKPKACAYVRALAKDSTQVANRRHEPYVLSPLTQLIIEPVDGEKNLEEISKELLYRIEKGTLSLPGQIALPTDLKDRIAWLAPHLHQSLNEMAKHALLEA